MRIRGEGVVIKGMWKREKSRAFLSACVLGLWAFTAQAPAHALNGGSALTIQALFVSDIHFEPFWDPAKAAQLAAAPVAEWNTIFAAPSTADREAQFAQLEKTCHARGEDTSYILLQSSLRAIHAQAAGARFAIVSGDLLAHSFSCKYAALFPKGTPEDKRRFAEKTIDYVVTSLRAAVRGVPVYAALGNNDSDCGDYQLDANGAFLKESGEVFAADVRGAEQAQALLTFAAGGYYSVSLPAPMERARLVVLDDLFMSQRYKTCSGKDDAAPAAAQIAWLEQQLNAARSRKEKVWVMAHIPPGVDVYSTAIRGVNICGGGNPRMFLASEALPELLAGYGDVIRLAIFAHTHMDEMRLLEPEKADGARPGVAAKIVASISPIDGNNPSFTVAKIDAATARLVDYRVIAASNQTGVATAWREEYDFARAYKRSEFSAAALKSLIEGLAADSAAQTSASQSYIRNYGTGMSVPELQLFWPQYTCTLKNDEAAAFQACVCGAEH